jgi:hypothetical protein
MNERIIKHGLDSGMLNYVDHETPRHYFLSAHADEECLEKFAELIVRECANVALREDHEPDECILHHFGLNRQKQKDAPVIEEAEKQKPVGYVSEPGSCTKVGTNSGVLHTEWVGLTDEDIDLYAFDIGVTDNKAPAWLVTYARGIEAKLKEKNNG